MDMRTTDGAIADETVDVSDLLPTSPISTGGPESKTVRIHWVSKSSLGYLRHWITIHISTYTTTGLWVSAPRRRVFPRAGLTKAPLSLTSEAIDVMPRIASETIAYIEQQSEPFFVMTVDIGASPAHFANARIPGKDKHRALR